MRHSVRVNGLESVVLTKLDVLDGLDPLKICIGYRYGTKILDEFPSSRYVLSRCKPIYRVMRGWKERTYGVMHYRNLPANAQAYITKLESLIRAKVSMISMGRSREETIIKDVNLQQFKW